MSLINLIAVLSEVLTWSFKQLKYNLISRYIAEGFSVCLTNEFENVQLISNTFNAFYTMPEIPWNRFTSNKVYVRSMMVCKKI